ncbi:MAG: helix-turn-helix transcriptional regulator [Pseudomonadota bacterium]
MDDPTDIPTLSEHEGALLNVVRHKQPVTGYQIAQYYGKSPVAAFNKSKGQIYPMIRRFNKAGLIEGSFVEGDGRGTEVWRCTDKGLEALRIWAREILDAHLLLDDPLRTRMMVFDLMTDQEKLAWILEAKAMIAAKLDEVKEFDQEIEVPYQSFVHDNAVSSLRMRMDWLDRLLFAQTGAGRKSGKD